MWTHVDLTNLATGTLPVPIVQVTGEPLTGYGFTTNGKFVIPSPLGIEFPVDSSSYVLDAGGAVDGGDVSSIGFSHLLARFPMYDHIYFNPLLTSAHLAELVTDDSFYLTDRSFDPPHQYFPRLQTGRAGGADAGQMPTATALLPTNPVAAEERPGCLITTAIDISLHTLDCDGVAQGAREFMVYWQFLDFGVSHDIASNVGVHAGENSPSVRAASKAADSPVGLSAYLTTDEGATWCEVRLLEPVSLCNRGTSFRLAFRNDSGLKLYLANFAVMFRSDV